MRGVGFEPTKALSHTVLSRAPSTAWVSPRKWATFLANKKMLAKTIYKRFATRVV